jgi:predicted kinase
MRALILIRGLPGAGKTTFANVLAENKWPVFSVDSYFTDPQTGEYTFDHNRNHLAYAQCERRTEEALRKGVEKVFLDNTFTMEWEMEPYFKLAAEHGYTVFVTTIERRHTGTNSHGVSDEQLRKMTEKFKVVLM